MTAKQASVSRRSVLMTTGAVAAYAVVPFLFLGSLPAAATPLTDTVEAISFLGKQKIQLTIVETKLTDPPREVVSDTSSLRLRGGNNPRYQGHVAVDGRRGVATGSIHTTAPQLFRPFAQIVAGTELTIFDGADAPIDQPENWTVAVDGVNFAVREIYRKSVPIKSERIGRTDYVHSLRHLLTIVLNAPVAMGAAVNLSFPGLGTFEVTRDDNAFSEAVHVCQQGYPTAGPKKGYVGLWLGQTAKGQTGNTDQAISEITAWSLVDANTDEVAISGTLALAKSGAEAHRAELNFNGCDLYEADFSDLDREGIFRLVVAGIGSSYPFEVKQDPYFDCFRAAARWYFHQRSGIAIAAEHGEGRTRPRNGHPDDGLKVWQSAVELGQTREGYSSGQATDLVRQTEPLGLLEETDKGYPVGSEHPHAWGGWHDAGDWDRRIQHMDVVFAMANMVELFETSRAIDLNIPESGKPFADAAVLAKKSAQDTGDGSTVLPDLIHEALWGISLWRRTQTREGGILGGVEYSRSGSAGTVSWNPHQLAFAYQPEPWAAYRFAIGAAKLGQVISKTVGDAVLGQSLIDEAASAWLWAEGRWPDIVRASATDAGEEAPPDDPSHVPSSLNLARIAAAATVYRATGLPDARAVFEAHNPFLPQSELGSLGARPGVYAAESLEYLYAGQEGRDVNPDVAKALQAWGSRPVNSSRRMGQDYGLHSTADYPWGRGWARFGPGANWRASELAIQFATGASDFAKMREIVVEGMWFGLGCNPSNVSFVQGFGSRQFGDPSGADYYGFPKVPGQIAFGVVIGELHPWELRRISGHFYPDQQTEWPIYAQIFESKTVNTSAEHGMKANAMEWLFANAFAHELMVRT
ncbi:MAG: glycoside hydrolase family 9 protein [Pseudomonadota bacterium]